jgi:hypothetical protein
MIGRQAHARSFELYSMGGHLVEVVTDLDRRRAQRSNGSEPLLRCVSTGYLGDGCSCETTIPAEVVAAAWREEVESSGNPKARFFRFVYQRATWLAFGLEDGRVRGVYCPEHSAERDSRASVPEAPAGASALSLLISA